MNKISRRKFLEMTGLTAALYALAACQPVPTGTPSVPPVPTGSPTRTPVILDQASYPIFQALKRITFGPTPADLARANQIGLDAYIEEQLSPAAIADDGIDQKLSGFQYLQAPFVQLQAAPIYDPAKELTRATLLRAVYSRRQLNELMVDFWTNHFNIYIYKTLDHYFKLIDDREVIRPFALGKFSDLLSASAHSPAMLIYLDNASSTKDRPNENYARELLELHTLSPASGYTQDDVHQLARILTGWTAAGKNSQNPGSFLFNASAHDPAEKTLLGQVYPAGNGVSEGEKVLQILAAHPATAQFISTKLVRRFVADDPPPALVARAAQTFAQSGGDLRQVLSAILHSAEFKASLGTKVKRPFEFLVSALRQTGAQPDFSGATVNYLDLLGQPLFRWETPDGYPDTAAAWTSTNNLLARWNFALGLVRNTFKDSPVDPAPLASGAQDLAGIIRQLSLGLLGEPLPDQAVQILTRVGTAAKPASQVPVLTALILSSPFFQYR